jgi:hypothetical protein
MSFGQHTTTPNCDKWEFTMFGRCSLVNVDFYLLDFLREELPRHSTTLSVVMLSLFFSHKLELGLKIKCLDFCRA